MSAELTDGITHPPIDELLDAAGSKYSLVLYAAKRARQINAYYSQLGVSKGSFTRSKPIGFTI